MSANHLEHVYVNKSGVYTARLRVPADLQPVIRKTELHQSLRTKSKREAKTLAPTVIAQLQRQLDTARQVPQTTSTETLIVDASKFLPTPHYRLVLRDLANHTRCDHVEQLNLDLWQLWCFHREDLQPRRSVATLRNEIMLVRSAILKLMAERRLSFDRNLLASPRWRQATRDELRNRDQANSPYALPRWQELYDGLPSGTPIQRAVRAAFALGLFTGARISEIANITADQISGDLWSIPRSKTLKGERIVPLIPQAQQVLSTRWPDVDGFLFPRMHEDWNKQAMRLSARINYYLKRAGASRFETMHSTRATFRTLVPRCAASPEGTIDMLMGHNSVGHVSASYYRATLDDCIELMRHYRPDVRID